MSKDSNRGHHSPGKRAQGETKKVFAEGSSIKDRCKERRLEGTKYTKQKGVARRNRKAKTNAKKVIRKKRWGKKARKSRRTEGEKHKKMKGGSTALSYRSRAGSLEFVPAQSFLPAACGGRLDDRVTVVDTDVFKNLYWIVHYLGPRSQMYDSTDRISQTQSLYQ